MMANNKKTLYIGGLAEDVDINIIRSAFSPFGDIIDVNLPLDYTTQKHKGFAFIEFQLPEDAADAIDNMDNGELMGRTIRVNIAKPMRHKDSASKPIWADDEYFRKMEAAASETNIEIQDDDKRSEHDEG